MPSALEITLLVATVASGITAGVCFAFATFLMKAFDRLGPTDAIRVMQSLNAMILRSATMATWFGAAIAGVIAAFLSGGATTVTISAALYAVAAILITGRGNVPLNEALDRTDPHAPEAAEAWQNYQRRWGQWNWARTILMVLATTGFALADKI